MHPDNIHPLQLKFDLLKSEYVILPLDSSVSWLSIFNEAKPAELSQSELAEMRIAGQI